MNILILDNHIDRDCWGASELCAQVRAHAPRPWTLEVRRAPESDFPSNPSSYDAIIVSGSKTAALDRSAWVEQEIAWIRNALDLKIPYLGVCFGHQVLARALGGIQAVAPSAVPEWGWTRLTLSSAGQRSVLFKGLPKDFHSFSWHQDEVIRLPSGAQALASSSDCELQALELGDRPAFGIQFHAERPLDAAETSLKKKLGKSYPSQGKTLFDPIVGQTIFKNFLESSCA